MALNQLLRLPRVVPLIPGTGFSFSTSASRSTNSPPRPRTGAGLDTACVAEQREACRAACGAATKKASRVNRIRPTSGRSCRCSTASGCRCRCCAAKRKGFYRGPTNWARAYLAKLDEPDDDGNQYRLVLAADTRSSNSSRTRPISRHRRRTRATAANSRCRATANPRRLVLRRGLGEGLVPRTFKEMLEREERRRRKFCSARSPTTKSTSRCKARNEHIARYKAFSTCCGASTSAAFKLVDRITEPRTPPIDVDLVLDLGNSRSCGLLIESDPEQLGADITKAVTLQLRDLGSRGAGLCRSVSEPVRIRAGDLRPRPPVDPQRPVRGLRVADGRAGGVEAARLAARRSGTEGSSGLSSPKRYLWDEDPPGDSWRFNSDCAESPGHSG